MIDKSGAPLLAVGQEVEADPFLIMDAQRRGVVLRLFEFCPLKAKHGAAALVLRQPTGPGETADGRGGDRWKLHGSPRWGFVFGYICTLSERQGDSKWIIENG